MIEALGRQADLAFPGIGMVLDIQLVQHQAELADEEHNDKYKPAEPDRQLCGSCESVDHEQ